MGPSEKDKFQLEGGRATAAQMDFLEKHSTFTRVQVYKMSKAEASKHIDDLRETWESIEADLELDEKD